MKKTKILFTLLLLGSSLVTILTSWGNLEEHSLHLFLTLLFQTLFMSYIWKDKLKASHLKTQKGLLSSIAVFSLFLFVSAHVIPTGMLMDHHSSDHDATGHQSQHACCIPVMPVAQIEGFDSILGYVQEIIREPKKIHTLASANTDTSRSPPLV